MHEWLNGKDCFFGRYGVFTWQPAVGGRMFIQGYSHYTNITREYLQGRKYLVTLWDYKPGVTMIDETYDPRTFKRVPFRSPEEQAAIEAYAESERIRMDTGMRAPFDGVW